MKLTESQIRSAIRESLINSNGEVGPNLLSEGLLGGLKFVYTGIKNRYRGRGARARRTDDGGRGLGGGSRAGAKESALAYTALGLLSYDALDQIFQWATGETLSNWLMQWQGDSHDEYYIKACCTRSFCNDVDALFANETSAEDFFREEFDIPESTPISLTVGGFHTMSDESSSEPTVLANWRRTIRRIGAGTSWIYRLPYVGDEVDFNDEEINLLRELVEGLEAAEGNISLYDLSYKAVDNNSIADTIISGINLKGTAGLEFLDPSRVQVRDLIDRWVIALRNMPDFVMRYHNSATNKHEEYTVSSSGDRPAIAGMGSKAAEILSQSDIVKDITDTAEAAVAAESPSDEAGDTETTSAAGSPEPVVTWQETMDSFERQGNAGADRMRSRDDVKAVTGATAASYGYALASQIQDYITSKSHSDINDQDKLRLREAALDVWQTSGAQAGAVGVGKIMYLLERMGYSQSNGKYTGTPRDGFVWIMGQMR